MFMLGPNIQRKWYTNDGYGFMLRIPGYDGRWSLVERWHSHPNITLVYLGSVGFPRNMKLEKEISGELPSRTLRHINYALDKLGKQ